MGDVKGSGSSSLPARAMPPRGGGSIETLDRGPTLGVQKSL